MARLSLASLLAKVEKQSVLSIELLSIEGSESEQSDKDTQSDTESQSSNQDQVIRSQGSKMISSQPVYMSVRNWLNIILLGFGFMFLFTAFQTSAFVQVQLDYGTIIIYFIFELFFIF